MSAIYIYKDVYKQIGESIGSYFPERGGVLGAAHGKPISKFYYDSSSNFSTFEYEPDYIRINHILQNEWKQEHCYMVGMIHSHESSAPYPSCGDIFYAEQILKSFKYEKRLFIPVVTTEPFAIHGYQVVCRRRNLKITKVPIQIIL